jgi:hypothetical protein
MEVVQKNTVIFLYDWHLAFRRRVSGITHAWWCTYNQGILKGEVSLYHWPPVWFGLVCFANKNKKCQLSCSQFQTSQTGGQWYSDNSPFSIPCYNQLHAIPHSDDGQIKFSHSFSVCVYVCVPGLQCYKTYFLRNLQIWMFALGKPFQPSLMFVNKAGAYPRLSLTP